MVSWFMFLVYYPTNATLVCVLSDIKSAVILSIFVFGDTYLGDGAGDRREVCTMCERASPLLMAISLGSPNAGSRKGLRWTISGLSDKNLCHLTANFSKIVSRSVTCRLELNISSTKAFEKLSYRR